MMYSRSPEVGWSEWPCDAWVVRDGVGNKMHPSQSSGRALPCRRLARRFVAAPFPAAATPQESRNVPEFLLTTTTQC